MFHLKYKHQRLKNSRAVLIKQSIIDRKRGLPAIIESRSTHGLLWNPNFWNIFGKKEVNLIYKKYVETDDSTDQDSTHIGQKKSGVQ